jgi:hypothetical protein
MVTLDCGVPVQARAIAHRWSIQKRLCSRSTIDALG